MANIQLLQRTNKPKKNGTFPIIFKIYLGTKSKIITLPFQLQKRRMGHKKQKIQIQISQL